MHWVWSAIAAASGQRIRVRQQPARSALYLTFDDGPHPEFTPRVLDVLAEFGAKATFFLLGQNAERHPDLVRRMLREGHTVGNHSMSHINPRRVGWRTQLSELDQADRVLSGLDGQPRHIYRPPGGCATPFLLTLAVWRHQSMVLWTFDSMDGYLDEPGLIARLKGQAFRSGDVILFHDDTERVCAALRSLLPAWQAQGFAVEAIPVQQPHGGRAC